MPIQFEQSEMNSSGRRSYWFKARVDAGEKVNVEYAKSIYISQSENKQDQLIYSISAETGTVKAESSKGIPYEELATYFEGLGKAIREIGEAHRQMQMLEDAHFEALGTKNYKKEEE